MGLLVYALLLVPMPPLAGFAILALSPTRMDRRVVLATALFAGCLPLPLIAPFAILRLSGAIGDQIAPIFSLFVGQYEVALAMGLTAMSAVVALTVAFISTCVMIYAGGYMSSARPRDQRRFFALMNLFQAGMLSMVLAADSIIFFLGWELMGLCSFFLISYNMTSPRAFAAGQKAFVITRIADAALLAALLLLFLEAGSVRLADLIPAGVAADPARLHLIAALLLIGAMGKSAQFPFHTWLPTAMAGPTPVSALLHSATMVAAGAVLLAIMAPIIGAYPGPAASTALAGALTAIFGAACATVQTDVKRLLAFSSISQIGYMFLAVGVGAPAVAMAHFVVHAVFKSLLFMAAGVLSDAGGGSTEIRALRGTARITPISFLCYTAGAASLAGLPVVTAGWWSKEAILAATFDAGAFGVAVWGIALAAAVLTGVYAFRPVLTALQPAAGPRQTAHETIWAMAPLILLAVLALAGALFVEPLIQILGGDAPHAPRWVEGAGAAAAVLGLFGASAVTFAPALARRVHQARRLRAGLQMDARYYATLVRPYRRLVRRLSGPEGVWVDRLARPPSGPERSPDGGIGDPVGTAMVLLGLWLWRIVKAPFGSDWLDKGWMRSADQVGAAAGKTRLLQTGRVRDYAMAFVVGLVVLLFMGWATSWN